MFIPPLLQAAHAAQSYYIIVTPSMCFFFVKASSILPNCYIAGKW